MKRILFLLLTGLLSLGWLSNTALAQEFTSSSFRNLDPVINAGGEYSSSASFILRGIISQIAIGTSTASSYRVNSGFLYFPQASTPVVSASAGDGSVSLSWTASTGFLGWDISSYSVGQSTTSGGPYTYSSVGNVTSSDRTGLSNGTTYYFIVRANDAFGNPVATSTQVSSSPVAAPTTTTTTSTSGKSNGSVSGGAGGAGGGGLPASSVKLKGYAYPKAKVTVLSDGFKSGEFDATKEGDWEYSFDVSGGGLYTFSVYALDTDGRRSVTFSITTKVPKASVITVSDIVLSPTISADKSQVKFGNNIRLFGSAYPGADVNVIINSDNPILDRVEADIKGIWSYVLNSSQLERGGHTGKSQTVIEQALASSFSESLSFQVGDRDVDFGKLPLLFPKRQPIACSKKGDINNDGKINIIDFSILLFFWNQTNPKNICTDINGDSRVNLADFSIMLYWWTG